MNKTPILLAYSPATEMGRNDGEEWQECDECD